MVHYEVQEKQGDRGYLRLRGSLVGEVSVAEFKRALECHYVDDGVSYVVADVSDVTQVSLEGVATLLELWRESGRRGKHFLVEGARGQVRDKLEITGTLGPLERG